MHGRVPGAFDDSQDAAFDMDTIVDEQPHGTEYASSLAHTTIHDGLIASSSTNHPKETSKSGFICESCASSLSEEVEPNICGLCALASVLTVFVFDKEETAGISTGDCLLNETWLRKVLETVTESMKGEGRQSIDHLLKTPLFHESLSLSRHTWLTYESSLEEVVSSAFSDIKEAHLTEGQPVAILITRSSEGSASTPYDTTAVAVAVQLHRPSPGHFALIGCHKSEGSPTGQICIKFYDSTAAMCQQLTSSAQPADSLYILTPGAACNLPFGREPSTTSAQPVYQRDLTQQPQMYASNLGGEEPTSEVNGPDIPRATALPESASPLPAPAPNFVVTEDSASALEVSPTDDLVRVNSPPPAYVLEDPCPTPSEDASLSNVALSVLAPREASAAPDDSYPALESESRTQHEPESSVTVREVQASAPQGAPTQRKPVQVNRDFEWMHALQTSGPIIHPLPTPASSQNTSQKNPQKTQKKVRIAQSKPAQTKKKNQRDSGSAATLSISRSDALETHTHASASTASSSKAPQPQTSKPTPSTPRGPQFLDTNQLDLLFSAPKKRPRGDVKDSNQPSSLDAENVASEMSPPSAFNEGQHEDDSDLRTHASQESASELRDETADDGPPVRSTLSHKAAMKQKERVNPEGSKRRDFEWQLQLMGTSKIPSTPSSSGFTSPSSGKGAAESSKSRQAAVPWSPLMLRPELVEVDAFSNRSSVGDDFDVGGGSSSSTRSPRSEEGPSFRQTKSFKASRNDIAWQLALVSTVLKPSEEYMKEQEKKFIQSNPRYRPEKFDCLICFETIAGPEGSRMMNCEHSFCRDCMTGHVRSQLEENLYPIICPVCFPDPERTARGFVDDYVLDELDLTQKELDKFEDLQLAAVIVKIDCPGCKQVIVVAREDYLNEPFLTCNLPGCSSRFCRACLMVMVGPGEEHTCKVDEELDALMTANGWRYCPGCRTPILKESGCNHMTCKSPGCTTHFCYVCGDSVWDATSLESLHVLLNAHYRHCNQFDPDQPAGQRPGGPRRRRRDDCTIQ